MIECYIVWQWTDMAEAVFGSYAAAKRWADAKNTPEYDGYYASELPVPFNPQLKEVSHEPDEENHDHAYQGA